MSETNIQKGKDILIIDDDEIVQMSLQAILQEQGYAVHLITSRTEIFPFLSMHSISLILLDVYLGDVEGTKILSEIQALEQYKNIPVIMITGDDNPELLERCFDLGASDFIAKPVSRKILLSRIRAVLKLREQMELIVTQKEEIYRNNDRIQELYEVIQRDLDQAGVTQSAVISSDFPDAPDFNVYSYYKPFSKVGGDFLSYSQGKDFIDFIFGDVSGHGISSAMVSCMSVVLFKTIIGQAFSPAESLEKMHHLLRDYIQGHFVTAIYFRYWPSKKKLEYSYAGHHNIVLLRNNEVINLEGRGTPILLFKTIQTKNYSTVLEKGDRLLLFSDGLFEVFDEDKKIYGLENFILSIKSNSEINGVPLLEKLASITQSFPTEIMSDDMTMMLFEVI